MSDGLTFDTRQAQTRFVVYLHDAADSGNVTTAQSLQLQMMAATFQAELLTTPAASGETTTRTLWKGANNGNN